MYSIVQTALVYGMECKFISVEADVSDGLPMFDMVGYLSGEVKEAKERIRAALKNCGFQLPPKRITVNLSPINLRKEGNNFDLPVALAIMRSMGLIYTEDLDDFLIIGEVGLNGSVRPFEGVLPVVCGAAEAGYKGVILPYPNVDEALLARDIRVVGVRTILDAMDFLNGDSRERESFYCQWNASESEQAEKEAYQMDFSEISGQESTRRACEIAVAGMHNLLMIGPPGAGKTMLARRIPTILPTMTYEEELEVTKIYSVAGKLPAGSGIMKKRPFRSPHHTISMQGLAGGGKIPKPGEISLAHRGVLFLDELPEFHKDVIETLRQPLEDKQINIVRQMGSFTYPSDFMLVCACNPCNCGYYPDRTRCFCSPQQIQKYFGKISRPILDRIDIAVEVSGVSYGEIADHRRGESSAEIRARIEKARQKQLSRYEAIGLHFNSELNGDQTSLYCKLNSQEEKFMEEIYIKKELTARSYYKILKVARTIADLEDHENIEMEDLTEAICYKSLDDKFFKEVGA